MKKAAHRPLDLPNGFSLTYGTINGLAGDYYGTDEPISDVKPLEEQSARFLAAWNTLATDTTRQPHGANAIVAILQKDIDAVNDAKEPSRIYADLPDHTVEFEELTIGRGLDTSFLGLAYINFDHFGEDARTAYNAGHYTALKQASGGTLDDLRLGYAMNAFVDHFLEDSFSSGHTRTPRRMLHGNLGLADICAKVRMADMWACG